MSKINEDVEDKILNLKKSFFSALKDYKQNYINYYSNNEVDEYKNIYYSSKEQLQEINSKLKDFKVISKLNIEQIKQQIVSNHDNNQKEIQSLTENKKAYDVNVHNLKNTTDTYRASNVLVNDYDDLYNRQFYKNFQILFGICILSFLTYKMKNV